MTGKWHKNINLSDSWLEALDMCLVILEFNFCWLALGGSSCHFIPQKLFMVIRGVTTIAMAKYCGNINCWCAILEAISI